MIVIGTDTGATGAAAVGSCPADLSIFDLIPEPLTIGRQSRNVAAIGYFVENVRRRLTPGVRTVAFLEAPVLQPKNGTVNAAQAGATTGLTGAVFPAPSGGGEMPDIEIDSQRPASADTNLPDIERDIANQAQ